MRVLVTEEFNNIKSTEVLEIIDCGFDDDITDVKNGNEIHDKYEVSPVFGLYLVDTEGDFMYIEGVSQRRSEMVCRELLRHGFADLSEDGICRYFEED